MVPEGIQSEDLCKIRSGASDRLNEVYESKYRIRLDHDVFYPEALYNDLVFEVTLALALQVVKGSGTAKLKYMLTTVKLEYEMIRSKTLADEAHRVYSSGKDWAYDLVIRSEMVPLGKDTDTKLSIMVNSQVCERHPPLVLGAV